MPVYIESQEVSNLLDEYAKRDGKSKTAALRDLLKRELGGRSTKSPEQRFADTSAFVKTSSAGSNLIHNSDFESLYDYLHVD